MPKKFHSNKPIKKLYNHLTQIYKIKNKKLVNKIVLSGHNF